MPFSNLTAETETLTLRQSAIIFYGNLVAFFDFLIYLYLADILSSAFFSGSHDPLVAKLQAFSLFSVGYLARPFGALILGRYGDMRGRRASYLISASILAITSLTTACLPTYAQVGVLAPILFIIARLTQGMAFGAHSVLGWVFIAEHAPKHRLAFFINIASAGHMIGVIVTVLIFKIILNSFSTEALVDYAWRIPFFAAAALGVVSWILGFFLKETPVFLNRDSEPSYPTHYEDRDLSLKRFHAIFISILLSFYISSLVIVMALILPKLILMKFSVDESLLSFANILGTLFIALGTLFFGLVADRNSTGKVLMIGSIAVSVLSFAFYYNLQNGSGDYILIMYALLGFSAGVIGLCPVVMTQLFDTKVRLTLVSVIYNTIYAIVGGALPLFLVYATHYVSFSPALYLTFTGLMGLITGFYIYRSPKFNPLGSPNK